MAWTERRGMSDEGRRCSEPGMGRRAVPEASGRHGMSTLLERMIQRARAPLSTLEPLSKPHFAPVPRGEHAWADSAAETSEAAGISEAAEAALEASAVAPRRDPQPGQRLGERPGNALGERPGDGPGARGRRRARPAGDGGAGDPADPSAGPLPGTGSLPGVRPTPGAGPPPGAGPLPGAPLTARAGSARARSAAAMSAPDGSPEYRSAARSEARSAGTRHREHDRREPEPDTAAMRAQHPGDAMRVQHTGEEPHDMRGRGTPEMEATAAGPGATPAVEAVTGSARLLPAEPPTRAPAGSRRSPAPPGPAADAPAAGPDVTVSIGHIEVRSAPAPDKPRSRPSFRPQVSLADFLGQQQDRRP